jgi:hypothetical protein
VEGSVSRRFWLLVVFLACAGCSPGIHTVTGTVKFDDTPVADGSITFVPEDKNNPSVGDTIKDGKYQVKAKPGHYKVEIRAVREVPGEKGPMGEPKMEDYIPAKYNDQTELTADVGKGSDTINFPLKSK